jgi:putative membrane protein
MMWYGFGAMSFLGPLMMLLFWGGLVVLAVWAVRAFSDRPGKGSDSALDILKRRLTSGEITPEEYEQARKVLQG